jgi:hypothetical protein
VDSQATLIEPSVYMKFIFRHAREIILEQEGRIKEQAIYQDPHHPSGLPAAT